jgi:hypothetical protein
VGDTVPVSAKTLKIFKRCAVIFLHVLHLNLVVVDLDAGFTVNRSIYHYRV